MDKTGARIRETYDFLTKAFRRKMPRLVRAGASLSDMGIYLDILELVHATAGGEGVKVLFRTLSCHGKDPELSVNARFLIP